MATVPVVTRKDFPIWPNAGGGVRLMRSRRLDAIHYWAYSQNDLDRDKPIWEFAGAILGIPQAARVLVGLENDDANALFAEGLAHIGCTVLSVRVEMLERTMAEFEPSTLIITPLTAHQLNLKDSLGGLNLLVLTGTVGAGDALRRRIVQKYPHLRVKELYYISEFAAPLAVECDKGALHWATDGVAVELLALGDDTPAQPGSRARVVVSDVAERVQPLVRYDTGDLVQVLAGGCDCGRSGPRAHRLTLGKAASAPTVFGTRLYSGEFVEALWSCEGTSDKIGANVRLDRGRSKDLVTICFEPLPGFDANQVKKMIAAQFYKSFGFMPEVTTNFPPEFLPVLQVRDFRSLSPAVKDTLASA